MESGEEGHRFTVGSGLREPGSTMDLGPVLTESDGDGPHSFPEYPNDDLISKEVEQSAKRNLKDREREKKSNGKRAPKLGHECLTVTSS